MQWSRASILTKKVGFAIGFIALGAIGDGVVNSTAKLPWLHQQAAAVAPLKHQVDQLHCEKDVAVYKEEILEGKPNPDAVHCKPGTKPDLKQNP